MKSQNTIAIALFVLSFGTGTCLAQKSVFFGPPNADFGQVKLGDYRDIYFDGLYAPGHANEEIDAKVYLSGDTSAWTADRDLIHLWYSTQGYPVQKVRVRFKPKQLGRNDAGLTVSLVTSEQSNSAYCHLFGNGIDSITSAVNTSDLISEPMLSIYPNPFDRDGFLTVSLPSEDIASIRLFNMLGAEVAVIADNIQGTGEHRIGFDRSGLPSGIYTCLLRTTGQQVVMKVVLR